MGDTIWLETTDGRSKQGGDRDNSIMLRLGEELDALADRLGVAKLSSFYDNSALAEALAEEFDDPDVAGSLPPEVWFEAEEGRRTLAALVNELRERPESLRFTLDSSRSHWPQALTEELAYCLSALSEAAAQRGKFHLLIVS
jgi:hypothetical protein